MFLKSPINYMKLHDLNPGAPVQIQLWSSIIELWRALLIFMGFIWHSIQLSEIKTMLYCAKYLPTAIHLFFKLYLYILRFVLRVNSAYDEQTPPTGLAPSAHQTYYKNISKLSAQLN